VRSLRITGISRRSGGYAGVWHKEQDDGQTQQNHGYIVATNLFPPLRGVAFRYGLPHLLLILWFH